MKRFLLSTSRAILLAGLVIPPAVRSEELPPDDISTNGGWIQTTTCAPSSTGSVDDLLPEPLGGEGTNVLSLSTQASSGTEPVRESLNTGLQSVLPPVANDLIAETVRALDCDWQKCYLFVRNQIHFAPYRGIMRGPERTLLDREGNDADQALLLRVMIRGCGYTNAGDVTVMYLPPPGTNGTGGFRVPLGGTASGYDAAAWFGVTASDSITDTFSAVTRVAQWRQLVTHQAIGGTVPQSALLIEHFWVRLNAGGSTYDLDPSFKPCRITPPSSTITNDMGYSRGALLAAAGGTNGSTGDKYSVKSLSTTNLATELCRLSGNLAAAWSAARTNALASDFVGAREIVVQDRAIDASAFHGSMNGTPIDYLGQSDNDKNNLRTMMVVYQLDVGWYVPYWLDEFAARNLFLFFVPDSYGRPACLVACDDVVLAGESAGLSSSAFNIKIDVFRPFAYPCGTVSNVPPPETHTYTSLARGLANIFAIPASVGNVKHNGMRLRALRELARLRATGRPETDTELRSRVLQIAGQQWMEQAASSEEFDARMLQSGLYAYYRLGVVGQITAPFYDIANSVGCQTNQYFGLNGCSLFRSSLEHAVWDQLNGTNHPSVSTVRIMDLANATTQSIFLATSNNYSSTIRSNLTNYTTNLLNYFKTATDAGRWLLIPQNGQTALNSWKGYAYIENGLNNQSNGILNAMIISGGLSGGLGTSIYATQSADVYKGGADAMLSYMGVQNVYSPDPVDLCAGAATLDRTDLSLTSPMPLALARHYDARQRHADGPFGCGWTHAWDRQVVKHADADARLGRGTPAASVPAAVAFTVVQDLLLAETNARNVTVACLVAKWWTDQLVEGTANVRDDGQTIDFQRSPDGSYTPAPGITATLATNSAGFVLQARLGNTTTCGTSGMVTRVQDPSSNYVQAFYHNSYNDYLTAISNSFGQKLTFNWTWNGSTGHVTSVSDSAGRTVYYRYSPSGCLTGVTDAAGFIWNYSYDSDNNLLSETDPAGVATVRNLCNSFGQVTNQVAANGQSTRFAFADGVSAWQLDALGGKTLCSFDPDGRLQQRITPDGCTNAIFYDSQGQILTNLDALGRVTVRAYNASNNLVSVTEAANTANARTTVFGYDNQFHLVAQYNQYTLFFQYNQFLL